MFFRTYYVRKTICIFLQKIVEYSCPIEEITVRCPKMENEIKMKMCNENIDLSEKLIKQKEDFDEFYVVK